MAAFRLPRRRHELILVLLLAAATGLIGFWLGRATAPDPGVAYLRGRSDGAAAERRRADQNRIELNILKGEVDATRTASKAPKSAAESASTDTAAEGSAEPSETAVGATN